MSDDIVTRLDLDGSGFDEALGSADAYVQHLTESIATLAESAGDFSALDEAMQQLSDMTAAGADAAVKFAGDLEEAAGAATDTSAQIDGLNTTIDQMSATITEDTTIISALNEQIANLEGQLGVLAAEEAGAAEGADSLGLSLAGVGEAITTVGEEFQAVMGPLMIVGTIASLVGGQLIGMGMSGQKGEALLSGMAGASQQDIQSLQDSALQLGETMDQASAGFYEVESAGYSGTDAIKVFDAASKEALGGQFDQQDAMSGLTAIMHDYNATADQATYYTDLSSEAILRGKQSAQDFSTSIGPLAAQAANVGISFDQVAAAEATMTQINPHVRQDTQQLTSLFQFLSPTMGGVVDKAKSLGLSFDEQSYSSMNLLQKLQYLSDIAGGTNTKAFVELTGGVRGSTAAMDLLQNNASAFTANLDAMGHSTGATQHAFEQFENTVPAHLDKVGASLSIFGTKLMDAIGPKVTSIIDQFGAAFSKAGDWILQHTDLIGPALAGLGAIIATILVVAMVSFVAASWPVLLILAAIGAVVGGVVYAFTHWGQIMGEVHAVMKNPVVEAVFHVLQSIGAFLASIFVPVWHQLVSTFQTQLVPAFHQLWTAIQPAIPGFELIAAIIGGILVVAIGILISVIGGLLTGFAKALSGIIQAIGGIVQFISGAIQVVMGIINFFTDLTHGRFNKLGADLGAIWHGVVTMFIGLWNVIAGVFNAFMGIIIGIISGFVTSIVGFFTNLYEIIIGHSIIPDMINGIVSFFEQLPDRAIQFVQNLYNQVKNILGGLGSDALTWAEDMLNQFVQGIENGAGKVGDAIKNIANNIKQFLGFSVPETGPLASADEWMPDMILLFERGITANQDKLKNAMSGVAAQMAVTVQPGNMPAPFTGSPVSGGNDRAITLLATIAQSLQQLVQQSKSGNTSSTANVAFNAVQGNTMSQQQFYQLIQSLSGLSYESTLRGSY